MPDYGVFADRERVGWSDGSIVDAYVARFGPITDEAAEFLIAKSVRPGHAVLDLCCGQGNLTAMICDAGARATGLDFSPEMLALAARAAPGAELREGDAATMPFDDESFDTVVCNFGMMHIPDQPKALKEIRRVLRNGGTFYHGNLGGS